MPLTPLLFVAVLMLGSLVPVAQSGQALFECSLNIAAVASSGGGVVGELTVRVVSPGSGLIFVSTSPATDVDVQGAARIAVLAASMLLGFNPLGYDYYFIVDAPSIIIGGPSAGAAMALGVLLALEGWRCERDFIVTGMINPDLTIGPVGGLKEKLEATAGAGGKTFIVPYGQLNYTYYTRVVVSKGPFVFITVKPETVNLEELGGKYGVRVREALSLRDVYSIVTGRELAWEGSGSSLRESPVIKSVFEEVAALSKALIEESKGKQASKSLVDKAQLMLSKALNLAESQLYYAAALAALEAAIAAQANLWVYKAYNGEFDVNIIVNEVNEELAAFNSKYSSLNNTDLAIVEFKGLAYVLSWTSAMLLNSSITQSNNVDLTSLSRAYWEAKFANIILDKVEPAGVKVDVETLAKLSQFLTATARSLSAYAVQIFSEAGLGSPPREALMMTTTAMATKDPIASLYLSAASISMITAGIHEALGKREVLGYIAEEALKTASRAPSILAPSQALASKSLESFTLAAESLITAWISTLLEAGKREYTKTEPEKVVIAKPETSTVGVSERGAFQNFINIALESLGKTLTALSLIAILVALIFTATTIIQRKIAAKT
ncbi:MAG: S16 family serine protease [Thermoprotei archaeon]|nr:S16 family serine protease [Thermoprotei archaeon]